MNLAHIIERYWANSQPNLSPEQASAAHAIMGCHTAQYGCMKVQCPHCEFSDLHFHSCGHRNCPACGQTTTAQWHERQALKLLPCQYFMVTFTLPAELRPLARRFPEAVFSSLFAAAAETLQTFANRRAGTPVRIGLTSVLHTHSRQLQFHPHVHCVVPAGYLKGNEWVDDNSRYLFNAFALAKVFRAIFLRILADKGLDGSDSPRKWVVHCKHVGKGLSAIQYLSRYLYRGVISEKNIVDDDGQQVTFRFNNAKTKRVEKRSLPGADFVRRVLQHVLPKGFRRVRDYGFLHGNAKVIRARIQIALRVRVPVPLPLKRPAWICPNCGENMMVLAINIPCHTLPG